MKMTAIRLRIEGMTCAGCGQRIEKKLLRTAGVLRAEVHYVTGFSDITYDASVVSASTLVAAIEQLHYRAAPVPNLSKRDAPGWRLVGLALIVVSLYLLLQQFGLLNLLIPSRLAETNMGYGMLFVVGLLTSVHCVAMCGGINLSQCIPGAEGAPRRAEGMKPAILYNLGRVSSYTAVGFVVGALGSAITFSTTFQGALKLAAGVFMVLMGVVMLGYFPGLRKWIPRVPERFASKLDAAKSRARVPFFVGLLNGLMPCGPLQSMQLYALSTASPLKGALSMFLFSLGTVPLMFGLGALSTALGKRFTRGAMTAGAVLVVTLGLTMFSQGFLLSGFTTPTPRSSPASAPAVGSADADLENGVQVVRSTLSPGRYPNITVSAGTPVRWIIDAPDGAINGCNGRMIIPGYNLEHTFTPGENIIEFTPEGPGAVPYSCWMGMIRGKITVV